MKTNTPDHIQNLSIESSADGCVCLEQDTGGTINRVYLHPAHLRHLAEVMGLTETGDQQACKTIAALTRRLLVLTDRTEYLAHWLANHSDSKHADLSYEQIYSKATADIAAEYCIDLPDTMPAPCKPDANTMHAPFNASQGKEVLTTATPQASLI